MADSASDQPQAATVAKPPRNLVRGERREIEEELANRVLSDISEEDANELINETVHLSKMVTGGGRIIVVENLDHLDRDKTPTPLSVDTSSHGGAPTVTEGLHAVSTPDHSPTKAELNARGRQPRPASAKRGSKSNQPVKIRKSSPTREAVMEVVISLAKGDGLSPRKQDDDDEFDRLMAECESAKQELADRRRRFLDDPDLLSDMLDDLQMSGAGLDVDFDEYDWETYYQQGPETYLMSTHNATLSARIRDYRRELWGDAGPLANWGILGWRNRDISIRERRRFSDVLREDSKLQKSLSQLDNKINQVRSGGVRRVHSDVTLQSGPTVNVYKRDANYAPVFQRRLKDTTFQVYTTVTLSCEVMGNPKPDITWYHNDSLCTPDARHLFSFEGNKAVLRIDPAIALDAGSYMCTASNEGGESSTACQLKPADAPPAPSRPTVELASDTEVFMVWDPPEMGITVEVDILAYRVEYRRAGDDNWACEWQTVSEDIEDEAVVIRHLEPQGIYQFRVAARSDSGWSMPSLSSRIIRTHPRGAPKLNVDVLKTEASLVVLSLPQAARSKQLDKSGSQIHALAEIREDAEEEEDDVTVKEPATVAQEAEVESTSGPVGLNVTDDPSSRFELGAEIARGRFSIVREAVDQKRGGCVAKILLTTGAHRNDSVREFEMLRELRHENIVQMLAAYVRDDYVLLFMERLHEPLLHRFAAHDYYSENNVARVALQILSAIQWIHFQGICHLNIRPDNILFANKRTWTVKLIDMGNAIQPYSEEGDSDTNRPKQPFDAEFTAPEVLTSKIATPIADIWNFGIVVFMLLSGFHPFRYEDDDTNETVQRAVTTSRLDLDLVFTNVSQESLRFVTWALKKHPARRMNIEEGLQHRWLAADSAMIRRRETIRLSSNRLRKLAYRYDRGRMARAGDCEPKLVEDYGQAQQAQPLHNGIVQQA